MLFLKDFESKRVDQIEKNYRVSRCKALKMAQKETAISAISHLSFLMDDIEKNKKEIIQVQNELLMWLVVNID